MITIDDFSKVELRVGTILEAENLEGSEKLIKLKVDLGEETPRQILAGLKPYFKPEYFVGKQFIFVANLEPRTMMGLESNGMILCADGNPSATSTPLSTSGSGQGKPVPLKPSSKVAPGSKIR